MSIFDENILDNDKQENIIYPDRFSDNQFRLRIYFFYDSLINKQMEKYNDETFRHLHIISMLLDNSNAIDDFTVPVLKNNIGTYFESIVTIDNKSIPAMKAFFKLIYSLFVKHKSNLIRISGEDENIYCDLSPTTFYNMCKNSMIMQDLRKFLYFIYKDVDKLKPYYNFLDTVYENVYNCNLQYKTVTLLDKHSKPYVYNEMLKPFAISTYKAGKDTMEHFYKVCGKELSNVGGLPKEVISFLSEPQPFIFGYWSSPSKIFFLNIEMERPVVINNEEYFVRLDMDYDDLKKYRNLISMLRLVSEYTSIEYTMKFYKEKVKKLYTECSMKYNEDKILNDLK